MGVVAHYYMDPELQGVLSSSKWPHVAVADSLSMGDAAVRMARDGATSIACLGTAPRLPRRSRPNGGLVSALAPFPRI